jgi:hypothetical protein
VASRLLAVSRGLPVPELDGRELGPALDAFVAAVRHAEAGEWPALAALDAELGRIGPGDALFDEASRLRIRWRLEQEEPSAGAEALALADTLLSRRWRPEDALLRASAAVAADRPLAAWGALERIAEMPKGPQTRSYTLRALEIAEKLPEEVAGELRARLARQVDTRAALPSPP